MLGELTNHLSVVTHAPLLLFYQKLVCPLSVLEQIIPYGLPLNLSYCVQFELVVLYLLLGLTL